MRVLVDTHVFLWIFSRDRRLSGRSREFLEDLQSNEFYFSDVSVWEASIKYGMGKLILPESPEVFFPDRVRRSEYHHLHIDLRHVTRVHSLPNIHGDPFDRLLITQAIVEGMTIVTHDPVFKRYMVDTLTIRDIS